MKTVTIIQRRMTNYRVPLFEKMRSVLADQNMRLRVLHGSGLPAEETKKDAGTLDWAEALPTRYLLGEKLCWQPFRAATQGDDLVIITQENRLVANHLALVMPRRGKLAFWGHGANLQRQSDSWKDSYKSWTSRQVDWWFAYTQMSVDLVAKSGFERSKITCLNNAIDTDKLMQQLAQSRQSTRAAHLARYDLPEGRFGLYVGSLYAEKRIDFLIEAAQQVKAEIPDFRLLIVGAGPAEAELKALAADLDWVHFMGARRGQEKADLLTVSQAVLNPGLVGLGIFDAMCAGRPLLTTNGGLHSPEISYLSDDVGMMTDNSIAAFSDAIKQAFENESYARHIATRGPQRAQEYGLDNMVVNFTTGIGQALGHSGPSLRPAT